MRVKDALFKRQLKLVKPILGSSSLSVTRSGQDRMGDIELSANIDDVCIFPLTLGELRACRIESVLPAPHPERIALYLHGGGYVAGSLPYARGFGSLLCLKLKMAVLALDYRLAPEHKYPAALNDAFFAYSYLLKSGYEPKNIVLTGDSAGGGMIFCLLQRLKQAGMEMPACAVAYSPWTDLTLSGASYEENKDKDPTLSKHVLQFDADSYIGKTSPKEPMISPAFCDAAGFPPTFITAGTDELLRDDAIMMQSALFKAGVHSELKIYDGMWHVFVFFNVNEAKLAFENIERFLREVFKDE